MTRSNARFFFAPASAIVVAVAGLCAGADVAAQPAMNNAGSMNNAGMAGANNGSPMGNVADQAFMKKAAVGGMTEVELSTLAQEKGNSDAVKQYGARMVEDHTKANDELKQLASAQNVQLPTSLDAKGAKAKADLSKLSGASFDRKYMSLMMSDHQATVALFRTESRSGKNPDAKAFAAKTLPTIEEHLKSLQGMHGGMKSAMN